MPAAIFRPKTGIIFRFLSINDVYKLDHLASLRTLFEWNERVLKRKSHARNGDELYKFHVCCTLAGDFLSPNILSPIDSGKGFMKTFNEIGITHFSLGNHEGNFGLDVLGERIDECKGVFLNSNIPTFKHPGLREFDVISVGGKKLGIMGLLSNEPTVFKTGKFKGHKIRDVVEAGQAMEKTLREDHGCDLIVAMTHQSMDQDRRLAEACNLDAILGGHEHTPFDETVNNCRIVKSGKDSEYCGILDLIVDSKGGLKLKYHLEPVPLYSAHSKTVITVNQLMEEVTSLEKEILIMRDFPIVAKGPRFRETPLAQILCSYIRSERNSEMAMINGATIKASKNFDDGKVSCADLKLVLPFPTKMVEAEIPGHVLQDAIRYSRQDGNHNDEKRGFLQVDDRVVIRNPTVSGPYAPPQEGNEERDVIEQINGAPFSPTKMYNVTLPRNLLNGFCNIKPLVAFREANPDKLGDSDVFIPAYDLVVQHCMRRIWRKLGHFGEIVAPGGDSITRSELRQRMEKALGTAHTTDRLLNQLMDLADSNRDGKISVEEFDAIIQAHKRSQ